MRSEPDTMAQDICGEILDVFGINLSAAPYEQRPHFGQASPADNRARRGAKIHAVLHQFGWRVHVPVRVWIMRPRGRDEALDVVAEALVQEDLLVDLAA